jgi:hypothetical protein
LQDDAFGDLELQTVGLKPGLSENAAHERIDVLGLELGGRQINRELGVEWPGRGIGASGLEDPLAERDDEPVSSAMGMKVVGGISPSEGCHERLVTCELAVVQTELGLIVEIKLVLA